MAKVLTVASNGQICIGREWAGRQISIEELGPAELKIVSGAFVPDPVLEEFEQWQAKNPAKKTDRIALMKRLRNKASHDEKY